MLQELIALEEQKIRDSGATGLSAERIEAVKKRLEAEKEQILAGFEQSNPLKAAAKRKTSRVWLPLSAAALLGIAVSVIFYLNRTKELGLEMMYTFGNARKSENTIATEAKSLATARLGEFAIVAAGENAGIRIEKAREKKGAAEISLTAQRGFAYFNVAKGRSSFSVTTHLGTIQVTGTGFGVDVTSDAISVQVLEGSVEARSIGQSAKSVKVMAGQKLSGKAQQFEVQPLTEADVKRLKLYDRLTAAGRSGTEKGAADQIAKEIAIAEAAALNSPAGATAQKLTLADIRQKYGKISRVNLKNGKSFTGYFRLKGPQIEIITPGGVVRVSTAELQDVQDMN